MNKVTNYLKYRVEQVALEILQEWKHLRAVALRNKYILSSKQFALEKNKVNLHYWRRKDGRRNLGDDLSPVVCKYLCDQFNIDWNAKQKRTKHLYAIGSILGFGCQNATVWGSGLLEPYRLYKRNIRSAKLDVRAVRGPLTREYLLKMGVSCPEVYGDPAILMPCIYQPKSVNAEKRIGVIFHFSEVVEIPEDMQEISIAADDYCCVIDEIVSSRIIVSSSLHGIILAESYGVPAVYLNKYGKLPFKIKDYYYSTNRYEIPVIQNLEDVNNVRPIELPDLDDMRDKLIRCFPKDLWGD